MNTFSSRYLRRIAMATLIGASELCAAPSDEIVFVAPTNHSAPLAQFQGPVLSGGILKDLGHALAQQLGKRASFVVVPSKRAPDTLREGGADLMCYAMPVWIGEEDFLWSQPVLPNAEVVARHPDAGPVRSLEDLRGKRVGTVLGYRYPDAENLLGGDFLREDAPTMRANLEKLSKGRIHYAFTDRLVLQFLIREHPELRLSEAVEFHRFVAPCALSKRSRLSLSALNSAIESLTRSGALHRLLARYGS